MNLERYVRRLHHNAEAIHQLVTGVSEEQARWKPAQDSWSILEVMNHLYDEEREDFRPRLDIMLHRRDRTMNKINPVGWVTERAYNRLDLEDSTARFMSERKKSIDWLRTIKSPDWDAVYQMPWGPMTAGDMFASWVTHDLLHERQLVRLHLAFIQIDLSPYRADYADS